MWHHITISTVLLFSTHDNDTLAGWYDKSSDSRLRDYSLQVTLPRVWESGSYKNDGSVAGNSGVAMRIYWWFLFGICFVWALNAHEYSRISSRN